MGSPGLKDLPSDLRVEVHGEVWVDLETSLLAKVEIVAELREPDGAIQQTMWQQAFGAYGADVRVEVPSELAEVTEGGGLERDAYVEWWGQGSP